MPEDMQDILRQIAEDNRKAFSAFYDLYFSKLYHFSKYFISSEQTCKEVVSDVFFSLWKNRKNLSEIRDMDNYLFISVKNQATKYKKLSRQNIEEPVEQIPSDFFVDIDTPEQSLITDEIAAIIRKSIEELPERCRIIFLMVREESLKYKEVAELLGISERTVHAQMIIAVKKIILSLQQYFPNFNEGGAMILFLCYLNNTTKTR